MPLVHIFDRSDSYSVEHASHTSRNDVVLVNATRSDNEYQLSVTMNGFYGNMWILDMLNNDEYTQVMQIAAKMRAIAKANPSYKAAYITI